MSVFIRYIILLSFLTLAIEVILGQSGNPFEIQDRLDSLELFQTDPIDTLAVNSEKPVEEHEVPEDSLESSVPVYSGGNPFEVSHIPLRSSEVEEKVVKYQEPKESSNNSFPFWLVIFSCGFLAVIISLKRSIIGDIRKSILNDNSMRVLQKKEGGGNNVIILLLYIIFFINISLFLTLALKHFGVTTAPPLIYIALGILVVYLIRHFVMFMIGSIFPIEKESSQFNFAIILYNIFIGIILIPINLVLAYGPERMNTGVIYLGIGMLILIYIMRQLRGFFISYKFVTYYKFHFFLYLCTCEIAPIFIIVKLLIS